MQRYLRYLCSRKFGCKNRSVDEASRVTGKDAHIDASIPSCTQSRYKAFLCNSMYRLIAHPLRLEDLLWLKLDCLSHDVHAAE